MPMPLQRSIFIPNRDFPVNVDKLYSLAKVKKSSDLADGVFPNLTIFEGVLFNRESNLHAKCKQSSVCKLTSILI